MKKSNKAIIIGEGLKCPKCDNNMSRRTHPPGWFPKKHVRGYYTEWDYCTKCAHMQHYYKYLIKIHNNI